MRIQSLKHPCRAPFHRGLLCLTLVLATGSTFAQPVYLHVDSEGRKSYTDRREAPISRRELAPLPGQTGMDSGTHGVGPNGSAARSLSINQREAARRLTQARREQARGPDLQQGIPPVAERHSGDRRRERVESLQQMVDAAQARVRELEVQAGIGPADAGAVVTQAREVAQR